MTLLSDLPNPGWYCAWCTVKAHQGQPGELMTVASATTMIDGTMLCDEHAVEENRLRKAAHEADTW